MFNINILTKTDKPKGFARLIMYDPADGRVIHTTKSPVDTEKDFLGKLYEVFRRMQGKEFTIDGDKFTANTTTLDARMAAARLLSGDISYKASRIEWGNGGISTVAQRSDTDLGGPLAPRIFTGIEGYEFPQNNIIKMTSTLRNEVSNEIIREIGLRTEAITPSHPNGLLLAHWFADAGIPKTAANFYIGAQWIYIYM